MSMRITPIHAIELNGLKGWGFSVFMDREGGASEIRAETARSGLSEVTLPTTCEEYPLSGGEGTQGTGSTSVPGSIPGQSIHSEQARFPSQGALEADPIGSLFQAGSADQFNDTGPHVFSDQEPS